MCPVLFEIGNLTVYGYGLMMALGMLAAMFLLCERARRRGMDSDMLFYAAFIGIIAGVIGSKILFWITDLPAIIKDPSRLLNLGGGFVIYGGLIGGTLAPFIYLRYVKKTTVLDKFDLAAPSIAIGQAFGRIGCFMAGCCYGKPAPEGAWYGITFPAGSEAVSGIPLYPVQLVSAIFDLLVCLFLIWYSNREKFRGEVICFYMALYSVGRFIIEFFRDDPRGNVGIFSTSQFIGIFIFVGALFMYLIFRKKNLSPLPKVLTREERLRKKNSVKKDSSDESGEEQ